MSTVDQASTVSENLQGLKILCKNFDVFICESGLTRFPRSSVFQREIPVNWLKIYPYEHFSQVKGMKAGKREMKRSSS